MIILKKVFCIIILCFFIPTITGCSTLLAQSPSNLTFLAQKEETEAKQNFILKESELNKKNTTEKVSTPISTESHNWWFVPNTKNILPEIDTTLNFNLNDYNGIYHGDLENKVLYLTFDEGYENGYTGPILDTLKNNNIKATFFLTSYFIDENPDLVKRMVAEGHTVGNHSDNHLAMSTLTEEKSSFNNELKVVEDKFFKVTGKNIDKFFRPPMGEYSEKSLKLVNDLGYTTVFWSFAYRDWDINNQPTEESAKDKIVSSFHNGEILLLHAVSSTNANVLDYIIKTAKEKGYTFKPL